MNGRTRWTGPVVAAAFCGLMLLLEAPVAWAVPASGATEGMAQPDGTPIRLRLFGDEFYHWHETADGYTVQRGPDGWWRYAVRDARGDLAPGPQRVGVDARPAGLAPKLRPDPAILEQRIRSRRRRGLAPQAQPVALAADEAARLGPATATAARPPRRVEPRGAIKNLVILCRFADHTTTGVRAASEYDLLFNEVGHSTDGAAGSVKDYFNEASYGIVDLQSTIVGWYALPRNEAYYGADLVWGDDQVWEMVRDAVNAADAAGLDFSQFDTDGDGWIDAIDIIHSGYGQEYVGADPNLVWSHRGWLGDTDAVQKDGVWISGYHTEPALRSTAGTNIVRIGVICHETGHFFGLPDLYDTDGATNGYGNGLGAWCLMASGSWGGDGGSSPQRPTHLCAWSKMQLGWVDPVSIHTTDGWSLPRVETNATVYKVKEGLPGSEYFLVSNRNLYGFDSLLVSGGLEILHVDEARLDNNRPNYLKVTFEEADGNFQERAFMPLFRASRILILQC